MNNDIPVSIYLAFVNYQSCFGNLIHLYLCLMLGLAAKGTIAARILAALNIFPVSSLSTHLLSKDRITPYLASSKKVKLMAA